MLASRSKSPSHEQKLFQNRLEKSLEKQNHQYYKYNGFICWYDHRSINIAMGAE